MAFDLHANLISITVTVAPSPVLSGVTFSISNADATALATAGLTAPFNMTVGPATGRNEGNQEIVRITAIGAANSGGLGFAQLTLTRQAETGGINRSILVGDTCKITITKKTITDLESAINALSVNTAWISSSDTFVYISATSVKITGIDLTAIYKKGTYVQFTNNAVFYGTLAIDSTFSSGNTILTFIPNDDFAVNNSAITSVSYSYQANPPGWPGWFNFKNTILPTGDGSMTFTGITVNIARFFPIGHVNKVKFSVVGTTGGSASNGIIINLPVNKVNSDNNELPGWGASISDSSNLGGHVIDNTAGSVRVRRYDDANFGLGAGRIVASTGDYEF